MRNWLQGAAILLASSLISVMTFLALVPVFGGVATTMIAVFVIVPVIRFGVKATTGRDLFKMVGVAD